MNASEELRNANAKLRKVGDKIVHSRGFGYDFIRSIVSSQTASWVDLCLCFALFSWVGMMPWLATACGAVAGGIVNCIINYKFTFRAQDCPWKAVVVKYILVWVGSISLNSLGTQAFFWIFDHWHWLESIGFSHDGIFAAARLLVSLLVSWCWNFLMQRNFVYRQTSFDRYAINMVNLFLPERRRTSGDLDD